jgi:hypothetical protein
VKKKKELVRSAKIKNVFLIICMLFADFVSVAVPFVFFAKDELRGLKELQ